MKLEILLFTSFLVYNVNAFSQVSTEGPRIEFTSDFHDYDTINRGSGGYCEFSFRNTGSEPLIITSASSSCGCTTPEFSRKAILPNKTGKIKVKYDTEVLGNFRKTIVVKSNAVNSPISVLRIKGYVREKGKGQEKHR